MRAWRISPILDGLKSRGTIDDVQHRAATRFLQEYYLGFVREGNGVSPGYGERAPKSANPASHEDQRIYYRRRSEETMAFIMLDPYWDRMLRWVIAAMGQGYPLSVEWMAERYAPNSGKQTASSRIGGMLALFCVKLCQHYGMDHPMLHDSCNDELSRLLARNFSNALDDANRKLLLAEKST